MEINGIDSAILRRAVAASGSSITVLITPLEGELSKRALQDRVHALADEGYLKLDNTRTKEVIVRPTAKARMWVRRNPQTQEGAGLGF